MKSKTDIITIILIAIIVVVLSCVYACGSDDTVSTSEMYQKCVDVNKDNPEECEQTFTVYQ
jgi:hypothetical protein